jgi:hypothetical protein
MKKTIMTVACALALTLGMTSCGAVGLVGAVYTGYTEPAAVTSNALGTKVGQASAISVLGVAAAGDAGINKAAKQAGITKVSHVDKKIVSVLGLYTKVTYTVYGE